MQFDILPTIEAGLYPSQSEHQKEIEQYFGCALLPALSPAEVEYLNTLDIFFVVFTNRCGSTLLTEIMHQLGFGIPPRAEVFNSDLLISCCRENEILSFTNYFMRLVYGWSNNYQVGFKIGAQQLFWLTRTGLLSQFRHVRIVKSIRQDTVSQAISFYIARQTGQWHSKMKKKEGIGLIPYCRDDILRCLHSIHMGQQLTNYYTEIHHLPSIEVEYENTLANPDREVQRLARFMNCPQLAEVRVDLDAVNIKQQRNEDNERLLELFKQDFFSHENSIA